MTHKSMIDEDIKIPLCVDLDGTLIREDTTATAARRYARWNPFKWLMIGIWFRCGRYAFMKQKLAEKVTLTSKDWTFVPGVLELLETEKGRKRPIYLVSATDQKFAHAVAQDPQCKKYFKKSHVIASEGEVNLRSIAKADYLASRFGENKFIYAGNSHHDLAVWKRCVSPVIVTHERSKLLDKLTKIHPPLLISII